MAQLFTADRFTPVDGNGHVYAGAQLFFYQTGTTTLQTVYADSGATTPLSNPVVADANGLFPAIYLSNVLAYKTVLLSAAGATLRTTDPINAGTGASTTFTPQGRLTLASGTPVMNASQASATSIIYTPYIGNQIPIYDGTSSFSALTFPELTNNTTQSSTGNAGPAAVTTNSNYDLFVWSNAGAATLTRGPAWTSDTARGTGAGTTQLQMVNGIQTNAVAIVNGPGANRGTYVGTVRSDGSSQINWVQGGIGANGTAAILGVWNAYNRVQFTGFIGDSTDSWTYTLAAVRAANNSSTMRVSFVQGLQIESFWAQYDAIVQNASSAGTLVSAGIGFDVTNAFAKAPGIFQVLTTALQLYGNYQAQALGFHFMNACESSIPSGTTTWLGDNGNPGSLQSGMTYRGSF